MSIKRRVTLLEENRSSRVVYVLLDDETTEEALSRAQKEWPDANVSLFKHVIRVPRTLSVDQWQDK